MRRSSATGTPPGVAALDYLEAELEQLAADSLLRTPDDGSHRARAREAADTLGLDLIDASSNDYLGLAQVEPDLRAGDVSRETLAPLSCGAGASRLIHGTKPAHAELERRLATWVGHPAALLFASGYAANVSVIPALTRPGDVVFSDSLNHASIIDGCRLSRARVVRYGHLDLSELRTALEAAPREARRWVVTESYFSMDGDGPDLPQLRSLCDECGAGLILDEAHALGVFGPSGAGLAAQAGVTPDVLIGTLGKSLGTHGAFVAGSTHLRTWLWNRARGFVFSTATSPVLAAITLRQLDRLLEATEARTRLAGLSIELRRRLAQRLPLPESHGPILPIILGGSQAAIQAAEALADQGILVQAIRPPTVPPGTSRLRVTATAALTPSQLERLAESLIRVLS